MNDDNSCCNWLHISCLDFPVDYIGRIWCRWSSKLSFDFQRGISMETEIINYGVVRSHSRIGIRINYSLIADF